MKYKSSTKKVFFQLILFLCLSVSATSFAQGSSGPPSPPGFDVNVDDERPLPIDGMLGLGLIAGTAIAFNKFRKK
ncbi:hypothetical protein [Psychroflexus halocasei]|uniref:PEP-CTERM protein-sorting domain-containing protein n=1 Tax=Psychroflexus halocasei TaxID=908615 RepID=A0A1H4D882_9FLAO|nr:hypothetical protein [Psychroflexus halocasei]SEA68706.1 hypothetical protein SAMN05421540_1108 [Psychroflexus halocasei]